MAVLQIVSFQVKPGRMTEFMEGIAGSIEQNSELGGKSRRVFRASVAGQNTGTISLVVEFENMAALGDFTDKQNNDARWQARLASSNENPPATLVSTQILTEITP